MLHAQAEGTDIIYHIAEPDLWFSNEDNYKHRSLITEGFIHCSTETQLEQTANLYFSNTFEIIVLYIMVNKIIPPLKYELSRNGEYFPHIFGPLNKDAVVSVRHFKKDPKESYRVKL